MGRRSSLNMMGFTPSMNSMSSFVGVNSRTSLKPFSNSFIHVPRKNGQQQQRAPFDGSHAPDQGSQPVNRWSPRTDSKKPDTGNTEGANPGCSTVASQVQ